MNRVMHIVSLNVPWPANYGGVIDIYYKLKALHEEGVKIILHCFEYDPAHPRTTELDNVCEEVHYYRRRTGMRSNLTLLPYNVYSRRDPELMCNLLKNDAPILFEGLHSCYYLNDPRLKERFKIFRACNIEHEYYREIAAAETHMVRKSFHYLEALRLKWFQRTVAQADLMLAVSATEADYLQRTFPRNRVEFVPCFHGNDRISAAPGQSDFLLYHGKLSVKENEKAALYLIRTLFSRVPYRCVIAGMDPSEALLKAAAPYANLTVEGNPSVERIDRLIREAQVNVLVTFQGTGLKLKLLNSLFAGRHVLVNPLMLSGTGLDALCHIARTPAQMIGLSHELMRRPFTVEGVEARNKVLFPAFSNHYQAQRLLSLIPETE
jgi:hypothetical protein